MQERVTPEIEYWSNNSVQLIPGLPDDVALHCLLRFPVSCRVVCKRLNDVLGNKERFFSLRKQLGFKHPCLFVIDDETRCQVLDLSNMSWHTIPPTNNWEISTAVGLTRSWLGNKSAVVYGHLFVLSKVESGEKKLKVYKPDNDSWEVIQGPPLPNLISTTSFVVSACDNNGILCVVGEDLDVAVGYITLNNKNQTGCSSCFSVVWQEIPAPIGLSMLMPRTCQLLYA